MDATTLRIILAVVGALILAALYWSGRRSGKPQGRRVSGANAAGRAEPQIGDLRLPERDELDPDLAAELARLNREITGNYDEAPDASAVNAGAFTDEMRTVEVSSDDGGHEANAETSTEATVTPVVYVESNIGARSSDENDRIVTMFVAANSGETFAGPDIIVAAEKTGLTYGHLGIFHRMAASSSEFGAVFSVANMVRPGRFEMAQIKALKSPGLTLFMVLPNAKSALDAWDMMLPTAQRLAELLGGIVLDEERNAMSRQRIQHIRDELRAYDRAREKNTIKRSW